MATTSAYAKFPKGQFSSSDSDEDDPVLLRERILVGDTSSDEVDESNSNYWNHLPRVDTSDESDGSSARSLSGIKNAAAVWRGSDDRELSPIDTVNHRRHTLAPGMEMRRDDSLTASQTPVMGVNRHQQRKENRSKKRNEQLKQSLARKVPWFSLMPDLQEGVHPHTRFAQELAAFVQHSTISDNELQIRMDLMAGLQSILKKLWPGCQIVAFGSTVTGTAVLDSDVDCVVLGASEHTHKPVYKLADAIRRGGFAHSIQTIANARVPLVKFVHRHYNLAVDISFDSDSGLKTSRYVRKMQRQFPMCRPLLIVLKALLRKERLFEVYLGGVSGYTLFLMLVSFFQLQCSGAKQMTLASALLRFLEFYGNHFECRNVKIHTSQKGRYSSMEQLRYDGNQFAWEQPAFVEDPCNTFNNTARGSRMMPTVLNFFRRVHTHWISQLESETFTHQERSMLAQWVPETFLSRESSSTHQGSIANK